MVQRDDKLAAIRRKTRQRYLYALITMGLYFSFTLNYVDGGRELVAGLAVGKVPGPVVMFALLVIAFIALESLFLYLAAREERR
jgi:hypothetical protein